MPTVDLNVLPQQLVSVVHVTITYMQTFVLMRSYEVLTGERGRKMRNGGAIRGRAAESALHAVGGAGKSGSKIINIYNHVNIY